MTGISEDKIGGLLLAAGGSIRLGQPKQLIEFEGSTLLRRAAETLAAAACETKVVVLGAEADECLGELRGLDLDTCVNSNWNKGMSGSIKAGLHRILDIEPAISAIIITLCDQPYVTADIVDHFIAEYRRIRPPVVAAEYNNVCGVPALFSSEMFDDLLQLEGDKGAQSVIRKAGPNVIHISVPEAAFDIDSSEDLLKLGEVYR
jgi:molybdenum cofactor cytidylyltransferase